MRHRKSIKKDQHPSKERMFRMPKDKAEIKKENIILEIKMILILKTQ